MYVERDSPGQEERKTGTHVCAAAAVVESTLCHWLGGTRLSRGGERKKGGGEVVWQQAGKNRLRLSTLALFPQEGKARFYLERHG